MNNVNLRSGFTLIELMVVVAFICAIAGTCVVYRSSLGTVTARSELYKLHAVCLYMQSVARSLQTEQHLQFTANGYQFDGQEVQFAPGVLLGCAHGVYGPPGKPTHAVNDSCSFARKRIDFYPDGIISAGVVYLSGSDGAQYALSIGVSDVSYIRSYEHKQRWQQIY